MEKHGSIAERPGFTTGGDVVSFGPFRLNLSKRLLTRDGALVPLGGRALDVLIRLGTQPGVIVGKTALMAAAWPRRRVEENNLTVQMAAVRRVLGTTAGGHSFIQTVSGRGYVLLADTASSGGVEERPSPRPAEVVSRITRATGLGG